MNKDRKIPWENISFYFSAFGSSIAVTSIYYILTGYFTGFEVLKYAGMILSVMSALGVMSGIITGIFSIIAEKKNLSLETDDVGEKSDAGGTTEENDKEIPPEYIQSVDSDISGYENINPDSEGDSGTETDGETGSEADIAKKEYMVKIYEESIKDIKVIAKDSHEAVKLAKEIYRNESPIVSDKAVKTTVDFIAKPFIVESDSEHEFFIGKKEGGKIII